MSRQPQKRLKKRRNKHRAFFSIFARNRQRKRRANILTPKTSAGKPRLKATRRIIQKKVLKKKPLKPFELRRRNQIRRRNGLIIRLSVALALSLALLFSVWKVARLERFTIHTIDVRGADSLEEKDISEFIFARLENTVGIFFPLKNTFFVPAKKIKNELEEEFLLINSANVLRKGFDELIVIVKERQPETIFCAENTSEENVVQGTQRGDCFFADNSGIIYKKIPHIARSQFRTIYFESDPDQPILGSAPLGKKEIEALFDLLELLKENQFESERVFLAQDGSFKIQTDKGFALVVPRKENYTDELSRFLTALTADVFKEDSALENVTEFDLRFGRKVFYKFRGE